MSTSKRKTALQALLSQNKSKQSSGTNVVPSTPKMPAGDIDAADSAKMDAQVNFSRLRENLQTAGISFADFLTEHSGITLSKPERTLKTPAGEVYTVASSHYSFEQLESLCVIDPDNVRPDEDREESALSDIIDEIGMGFQLFPIIAYIDEHGKTSVLEGSRRLSCALIRKSGLDVDIYDKKPTEACRRWIIETSDRKKGFSYFDKGNLYKKLMETHNWSKAELARERGYNKADISDSVNFSSAPVEFLNLLPTKSIPQSYVKKFNSAVSEIVEKERVSEAVGAMSDVVCTSSDDAINVAKRLVDELKQFSSSAKKTQKTKPVFKYGATEAHVKRTKKGSTIRFDHIPKDKEEAVLLAVEGLLKS